MQVCSGFLSIWKTEGKVGPEGQNFTISTLLDLIKKQISKWTKTLVSGIFLLWKLERYINKILIQQVGSNRSLCKFWAEIKNLNFVGFLGYALFL